MPVSRYTVPSSCFETPQPLHAACSRTEAGGRGAQSAQPKQASQPLHELGTHTVPNKMPISRFETPKPKPAKKTEAVGAGTPERALYRAENPTRAQI